MTTLDARVSVPEQVLFRDLGEEAVILELETKQYYGLDEVGTRMWTLLERHGGLEQVYRTLKDEYEVSGDQLKKDLFEFVDLLATRKLLDLHEGVADG